MQWPQRYPAVFLPGRQDAAVGKRGESREGRFFGQDLGPSSDPRDELRALHPKRVDPALARRKRDVLSFAESGLRLSWFCREDFGASTPGRDRSALDVGQAAPVHRAGINHPRILPKLFRLAERSPALGPHQIQIPRASQAVSPHHFQPSALRECDRWVATLTNRPVG